MNHNNEHVYQKPVPEKEKDIVFPAGLRVLAVDDNVTCLKTLVTMLRRCQYQVTGKTKAKEALELLRKNKHHYDIVITDVGMPDMDGFELLKVIGLEMDVPIIMMSVNNDMKNVMKGVGHGARDYLVKPVRMSELRNIWQHVMRKIILDPSKSSIINKGDLPVKKRRDRIIEKEAEKITPPNGDSSGVKKPRFAWSGLMHKEFVDVVQKLDPANVVPKKILEAMNHPGLTREIVSSHLQKYRNYLKKGQDGKNMIKENVGTTGPNRVQVPDTSLIASSDNKILPLRQANSSGESSNKGALSSSDQFSPKHDTLSTSQSNEGLMIVPWSQPAEQVQPIMSIPPRSYESPQIYNFKPGHSGVPMGYTSFGYGQYRPNVSGFDWRQPGPSNVPLNGLIPYPYPPGAFNIVGIPYPMLGDASTQFNPVPQHDHLPVWQIFRT